MKDKAPVFLAGLAVGAAVVGVVYFVERGAGPDKTAAKTSGPPAKAPAPKIESGVVLMPGESLVAPAGPVVPAPTPPAPAAPTAPATPAPSAPRYTRPPPPPVIAQPQPPPVIAQPQPSPAPLPAPPQQYSRDDRRRDAYERSTRSVCINCGIVTGITRYDYDWEVRVRFDDGERRTFRLYDRPRFELGEPVRLEEGRLVRE